MIYSKSKQLLITIFVVTVLILLLNGWLPVQTMMESHDTWTESALLRRAASSGQTSEVFPFNTKCLSNELHFFRDLISLFKKSGIAFILTETSDLLASGADFYRKLTTASLIRLGVLGEVVNQLERVVDDIKDAACGDKTADEAGIKIMKNYEDGLLVNVFFILNLDANSKVTAFLKKKGLPYYLWKRLHLRVFHQRGPTSRLKAVTFFAVTSFSIPNFQHPLPTPNPLALY